jgi:hypothetical protein
MRRLLGRYFGIRTPKLHAERDPVLRGAGSAPSGGYSPRTCSSK